MIKPSIIFFTVRHFSPLRFPSNVPKHTCMYSSKLGLHKYNVSCHHLLYLHNYYFEPILSFDPSKFPEREIWPILEANFISKNACQN